MEHITERLQGLEILQGVAFDNQHIGELAGFEGAETLVQAANPGSLKGRGLNNSG
jgi:hypothetical protein